MKKFILSFVVTGALLSGSPVTTTVTAVNAGNPVLSDGNHDVAPVTINFNGQNYAAMCIDILGTTLPGNTWTAYISNVGGDISHTYNPGSPIAYEEEAYLFNLILQPGADRIDIQDAAWLIFDPSYQIGSKANPTLVQQYLSDAQHDYKAFDFSGYEIISQKDPGRDHEQEFIVRASTPEPTSFALLGAGLLLAGMFRGWNRKKKHAFASR